VQDLAVEAKPVPGEVVLTSAVAAELFYAEIEVWGGRGWAAVARICQWAKAHGSPAECK